MVSMLAVADLGWNRCLSKCFGLSLLLLLGATSTPLLAEEVPIPEIVRKTLPSVVTVLARGPGDAQTK